MTSKIEERSFLGYCCLSVITLGIYPIIFWHKISTRVNILCEGDGQKTMKFVFIWLLNHVTFGIAGLVWRAKLAQRLKNNAARYNLKFSESAAMIVLYDLLVPCVGFFVPRYILVKNYNALAKGFNEYNGLEGKVDNVFADED